MQNINQIILFKQNFFLFLSTYRFCTYRFKLSLWDLEGLEGFSLSEMIHKCLCSIWLKLNTVKTVWFSSISEWKMEHPPWYSDHKLKMQAKTKQINVMNCNVCVLQCILSKGEYRLLHINKSSNLWHHKIWENKNSWIMAIHIPMNDLLVFVLNGQSTR